jgi:phosphoribosylformylglycinamidine (FGAM) synthase-like enzyme
MLIYGNLAARLGGVRTFAAMEITVKTAEQLRLTAEEFGLIQQKLGRTPNFTELCAFQRHVERALQL